MRRLISQLSGILGIMVLLMVALAGPGYASPVNYQITIDTSSLTGTTGYVDLQFNPGGTTAPGANAALTWLYSDATLLNFAPGTRATGSVTGALPGGLNFSNSTPYNDYFQQVVFGTNTIFILNFSGAFTTALSGPNTTFSVSLYDATGTNPILTTDPGGFGSVLRLDLAPGGGITTFNTAIGNTDVYSIVPVLAPAAVILFGSGLVGLVGWQRKRLN